MKLTRKSIGRIAASFVATAMLATMAIVPASAATKPIGTDGIYNSDDNSAIESFSFTKELLRPADVDTPEVTFTFTMSAPADEFTETITDDNNNSIPVSKGEGTASGEVVFGNEDDTVGTAVDDIVTVKDTVTIDISELQFDAPGIYKYILTETSNITSGDSALYTLADDHTVYLHVENINGEMVVTGVVLQDGTSYDKDAKTATITNEYMVDDSTVTNKLTVNKTVTGNMGDKNEKFKFTITIDAKDNDANRNYIVVTKDGAEVEPVSEGNGTNGTYTYTVMLSDGASVDIYGLAIGDTYKIDESDYSAEGYDNPQVSGAVTADNQSVTLTDESNDTVSYTNNRDAVSPTGIMMDIAPYAVLVVIAAAGCFIFLRKRHAKED